MPTLASLPKKLVPSKLRHRKDASDIDQEAPEDQHSDQTQFEVPTPDHSPVREVSHSELGMSVAEGVDREEIARLIAEYGSSSNTSWLEFSRYQIWVAQSDIPPSTFRPVQGYLRNDSYVFAWGNPLVSDPGALEQTCLEFWNWCKERKLKIVWCCVDEQMQHVLGKGSKFGWSTITCIVEDVLDAHDVVELAQSAGGGSGVKDFKKNIRRAEREGVVAREIAWDAWTDEEKKTVEKGVVAWKAAKSGPQLASTSFQPWVDAEHRRYWVAEKDGNIVAILILTAISGGQYQIKNAASFPDAPRGTSEFLIYHTMLQLDEEDGESEGGAIVWDDDDSDRTRSTMRSVESDSSKATSRSESRVSGESDASDRPRRIMVTFGVSASEEMKPVDNIGGWRVSWLTKTYKKVVGSTGITRRGEFRNKFNTEHMPMFVCYPSKQGFGMEGVTKLLKCLRQ